MKKIILGTAFMASALLADVVNVLPYGGTIDYGSDTQTSAKDKATLLGVHASVGTLDYLLSLDYSHIDTSYKDTTLTNLSQDDITLQYSKYYTNFMYKMGIHYINTNDEQLDNGIVGIVSLGGYKYYGYNKLSYGLDGYYSYYEKGHDEAYTPKSIAIIQITPYISFYKSISQNLGNTLSLKLNYQIADDYIDNQYTSYELSDTLFYKKFFLTLKGYTGDARTVVKDNGTTVYNTLDLMQYGYGAKLGYYLTPSAVLSLSYDENTYTEYDYTIENTNSVALASLSYSF